MGAAWRTSSSRLSATKAAATAITAKPTPTEKASLKPSVSAVGLATPLARRLFVRVVDTVVRIASPIPPPICWLVLMSPDARPASLLVTPVSAAMDTGTKEPEPDTGQQKAGKETPEIVAVDRDLREVGEAPTEQGEAHDQHRLHADARDQRLRDGGGGNDGERDREIADAGPER